MIIVGFDPGTHKTGYAVISLVKNQIKILEINVWDLDKICGRKSSLGIRLECLNAQAQELLKKYNPRFVGLEKAVSFKNVSSALTLSEARGVLRLAIFSTLGEAESRLVELSPTAVKRQATGMGIASKGDVKKVLTLRFPALKTFESTGIALAADAYDALAVAWTVKSTQIFAGSGSAGNSKQQPLVSPSKEL